MTTIARRSCRGRASCAAPLLLIHGALDENVHLRHSIRLVAALQAARTRHRPCDPAGRPPPGQVARRPAGPRPAHGRAPAEALDVALPDELASRQEPGPPPRCRNRTRHIAGVRMPPSRRHHLAALLLTVSLAATALAGGWANAMMDTPPDDPGGPNQPVTVGFTLLQHGETPVDWGATQIVRRPTTHRPAGRPSMPDRRAPSATGLQTSACLADRDMALRGAPRAGDHHSDRVRTAHRRQPGHRPSSGASNAASPCSQRCWWLADSWPC